MRRAKLLAQCVEGFNVDLPARQASLEDLARALAGSVGAGERPGEILDRRLASGEIDAETYDALRDKLRAAR